MCHLGHPEAVGGQGTHRHARMCCSIAREGHDLVADEPGEHTCRTWDKLLCSTYHLWRETRSSLKGRKKARRYDFGAGKGHAHCPMYCHMNHAVSQAYPEKGKWEIIIPRELEGGLHQTHGEENHVDQNSEKLGRRLGSPV